MSQGSVLGPLLFLIYINELRNKLLYDFRKVIKWLNHEYLTLNYEKTKFVIFTYTHIPPDIDIRINDKVIKISEIVKFLGVELDSKLTFGPHIQGVCNKVSKIQGIFYKLNSYLPHNILVKLYFALFISNITYCITAWENASMSLTEKNICNSEENFKDF